MVGVALKRKKEFKNTHKNQLIDPDKLFKMLEKLKVSGNKYYQFYDDVNLYKTRCKESDPDGYNVIFKDDIEDTVEEMAADDPELKDEILEESNDENEDDAIEYETKDPVKKYHFEYNKSLCMTNKYPEITPGDKML